jgi:hypothetical protein
MTHFDVVQQIDDLSLSHDFAMGLATPTLREQPPALVSPDSSVHYKPRRSICSLASPVLDFGVLQGVDRAPQEEDDDSAESIELQVEVPNTFCWVLHKLSYYSSCHLTPPASVLLCTDATFDVVLICVVNVAQLQRLRSSNGTMTTVIRCVDGVVKGMDPQELATCLGSLAASIDSNGLPLGFDVTQLEGAQWLGCTGASLADIHFWLSLHGHWHFAPARMHITEMRILCMAAKQGSPVLCHMPNRAQMFPTRFSRGTFLKLNASLVMRLSCRSSFYHSWGSWAAVRGAAAAAIHVTDP